jgi:two-component system, NtrC family, sensor kinase
MPVTRLKILYVEDNPVDVQLLHALLTQAQKREFDIVDAGTLGEALERLDNETFDAALVDLNLPDSMGLDTFYAIASRRPDLAIIVFTGLDREDVAMEAVRAGAQEYMIKGELTGELALKSIRYAVERKLLTVELSQANAMLEERIGERTGELANANKKLLEEVYARKRNGTALLESRRFLQKILDGIGAAVFQVDPGAQRITDCNIVAERLLGQSCETLVGARCVDHLRFRGEGPCTGKPIISDVAAFNEEDRLELSCGRVIPVLKTILFEPLEGQPRLVIILFDLSERKALERTLAHAQKMESIGQLAAGIAHEINTPIQFISGNLQFLQMSVARLRELFTACSALRNGLASPDATAGLAGDLDALEESIKPGALFAEMEEAAADSLEGTGRIATIVQAMKRFSHPDVEVKQFVNLNEAVQNTIVISRNEWKYVAAIETDLDENLPATPCNPGDINQVLLNLLVNAAHAIAAKVGNSGEMGRIVIRSRMKDGHAEISVEDDGCGIAEEHRERVFDPFFTTKEVGKGTGQGLAISYAIMAKHGGSIDFTTEAGAGTTFTIRLPTQAAPP